MSPSEIIATVIGALAAVVFIASYQMRARRWILLFGALSRILFVVQYLLLGALAGAALDVVVVLAAFIAQRKEHPTVKKLLLPLIILVHLSIVACTVLLYKNIFDIFVLLGTSIQVFAMWFTKEKLIRRISLCGSPCWLVYNIASKAYFSVASDTFVICSILFAMLRYDRKKCDEKSEEAPEKVAE